MEEITLKDFNMELFYLGFNFSKKGFDESDLQDYIESDFKTIEEWYLDRIK